VIEEIGKGADLPSTQVNNHFSKTLFSGTPYERPVLGTVSTITHLKRKDVLEYYHNQLNQYMNQQKDTQYQNV